MKKKTHQEFVNEVSEKMPNIIVIGNYYNNKTKIEVKCKICDHIWSPRAESLLHNHGCPKCSRRYKRTNEEFVMEIKSKNPDIEILSEFKNISEKVNVRCTRCGKEWRAIPNHLLRGVGCSNCRSISSGAARRKTHDDFLKQMQIVNSSIEIISEYEYSLRHVKCRCKKCGNIWEAKPANLLNNHGCPKCNESKGEKRIREYLENHNIHFEVQKKFDDLYGVNGGMLSYDFYLPNQNLLIEFQGMQHETPVNFGGHGYQCAKNRFDIQIKHDEIKRNYAESHNINFFEIWHYDFDNIEKHLDRKINLLLEERKVS